jgi:hypothetical protein
MKLNDQQMREISQELVKTDETKPVRFLSGGRALNITTGTLCDRGTNVMYHPVYWNFKPATVKKIVEWLGVKAVWSE